MTRFPRLRDLLGVRFDYLHFAWWRLLTESHRWLARLGIRPGFLSAVQRVAPDAVRYGKAHAHDGENAPIVIPIPDEPIFSPPPPKTLDDNILRYQLIMPNTSLFAARLADAATYGDMGDVVTADGTLLAQVSYRRAQGLWVERHDHPELDQPPLRPAKHLDGTYGLMTSHWAGRNYFHWMFHGLPRLALLERAGVKLTELDGFFVNHLQFPVQREMLGALGVTESHLRTVLPITAFRADRLWVTTCLLSTGHRRRWIGEWLRAHFLTSVPPRQPSRRLYLSRADAQHRRVVNEQEVIEFLARLGFEPVVIGERSIFDQSRLFSEAEIVIGPHTTGFANIVFCSPGTRVIDIMPQNRYRTYMWELSAAMGLDYYYALTDWNKPPYPPGTGEGDTVMNMDTLRAILKTAKIT